MSQCITTFAGGIDCYSQPGDHLLLTDHFVDSLRAQIAFGIFTRSTASVDDCFAGHSTGSDNECDVAESQWKLARHGRLLITVGLLWSRVMRQHCRVAARTQFTHRSSALLYTACNRLSTSLKDVSLVRTVSSNLRESVSECPKCTRM